MILNNWNWKWPNLLFLLNKAQDGNAILDEIDQKLKEFENTTREILTRPTEEAYKRLDVLKRNLSAKMMSIKDLLCDLEKYTEKTKSFKPTRIHVQIVKTQVISCFFNIFTHILLVQNLLSDDFWPSCKICTASGKCNIRHEKQCQKNVWCW